MCLAVGAKWNTTMLVVVNGCSVHNRMWTEIGRKSIFRWEIVQLLGRLHSQYFHHYLGHCLVRQSMKCSPNPLLDHSVVSFRLGNMLVCTSIVHLDIHLVPDGFKQRFIFVVAVDRRNAKTSCIVGSEYLIQCTPVNWHGPVSYTHLTLPTIA